VGNVASDDCKVAVFDGEMVTWCRARWTPKTGN
jgi:hypothetical protein